MSSTSSIITDTVYNDAADHIETHGWHQGGYYPGWVEALDAPNCAEAGELINERGLPCCLVGALAASGATAEHYDTVNAAVDGDASEWNDSPVRTKAEVVTLLRSIA